VNRRNVASVLLVISDAGMLAWGAMAALAPERLPGPGSAPIVAAGYEGFTRSSWQELVHASPGTAAYIILLFRLYGAYIVVYSILAIAITLVAFRRGDAWAWWSLLIGNAIAFGAAMTYDWTVNAIGPFEMSEYLGLALILGAFALTAPFVRSNQPAVVAMRPL